MVVTLLDNVEQNFDEDVFCTINPIKPQKKSAYINFTEVDCVFNTRITVQNVPSIQSLSREIFDVPKTANTNVSYARDPKLVLPFSEMLKKNIRNYLSKSKDLLPLLESCVKIDMRLPREIPICTDDIDEVKCVSTPYICSKIFNSFNEIEVNSDNDYVVVRYKMICPFTFKDGLVDKDKYKKVKRVGRMIKGRNFVQMFVSFDSIFAYSANEIDYVFQIKINKIHCAKVIEMKKIHSLYLDEITLPDGLSDSDEESTTVTDVPSIKPPKQVASRKREVEVQSESDEEETKPKKKITSSRVKKTVSKQLPAQPIQLSDTEEEEEDIKQKVVKKVKSVKKDQQSLLDKFIKNSDDFSIL